MRVTQLQIGPFIEKGLYLPGSRNGAGQVFGNMVVHQLEKFEEEKEGSSYLQAEAEKNYTLLAVA